MGQRPAVFAIKRLTFKLRFGDNHAESSAMGFGTLSQLHSLELEVRALCRTLSLGFEKDTFYAGVEPLIPFLVLEHENYDKGIPW